MATTLVERARQIISAEQDDFFQAETIQYYINKAQRKVVSYMVKQERQLDRSLRALDNLKDVENLTINTGVVKDNYFEVDVDFPTNLNQYENLVYNKRTILRELGGRKLYMLEWGNLLPTQYEGYFYVTNVAGTKTFRLYLHENPDGTSDQLDIFYVNQPTDIGLTDEAFAELPEQLENAVLYGAANMMATQEMSEATALYTNVYKEELEASIY